MNNTKKKVFVGMSGGVDSSVSAYLLQKSGYDVTGVFIKVWQPEWYPCTWQEDRRDALRVAARLGIPFVTLDLEDVYKREVVDYMVREYENGRTPNPDVMCNTYVKFGAFYKWARGMGADMIATGHYAQIETIDGRYHMRTAIDSNKDQTYFLWNISQETLTNILFPIGHMTKSDVREVARQADIPVFDKHDSQGLCFVGTIDMRKFLGHFVKTKQGRVVDEQGRDIGYHPGALYFTIGQRHGFTITHKTPHDTPLFVIAKDMKTNTLIVSKTLKNTEGQTSRVLEKVNLFESIDDRIYMVRTRYRQPLVKAKIFSTSPQSLGIEFRVEFLEPHVSASGQSCVIYDGDRVVGGGIIA